MSISKMSPLTVTKTSQMEPRADFIQYIVGVFHALGLIEG